ncbi:hypothetical protein HMPREF1544_03767 [Mucor circinelloides 1006PhL]|uniref:Uncharacterized protein n=1 Tax=Mucor circinelloides f. circinelloides (strain 1006PhL) TaxID=1220926 RepID=S2K2G8_MUCC1|nr:hypothetical protein HMPREF1544_03767 [Mucor circinelloides 1006PhL]
MNNNQQEDGDRERQRPNQQQYQQIGPENIFTNIYNVIAGARESASQEFTRFWESLGHGQRPYSSSSAAIQARKIKTPTSLKNRQFSRNSSINGRFLPDDNVRGIVKDVEIQTDDDLLQQSSLSIPHKRSASTFEEYHIPFPVKKSIKKTSFSVAEPDPSSEQPTFLSRRIDTTDNASNESQQEPKEEEEVSIPHTQPVNNKGKEPSSPLRPPPTVSLSPKRRPMRKAVSLSPNRPSSSSTAGRFTPSPNRDIRTGSKSVRRLTMELESQFSPKFPSPFSPQKKQRQESTTATQDTFSSSSTFFSSSPQYEQQQQGESLSLQYQSEVAAALASQAQAISTSMATKTSPMRISQPSPNVHGADNHHTNKDEEDYYANLAKQKELDERVNKLEKKVSIARTRVTEFSSEATGSHVTSPTPSHTIVSPTNRNESPVTPAPALEETLPSQMPPQTPEYTAANAAANKKDMVLLEPHNGKSTSPLRTTIINQEGRLPFSYTCNAAPAIPSANPYKTVDKSPMSNARLSTSPYRSSIIISSPQQPQKEASYSPPSMSYAAAKAAIQEAVNKKSSSVSPFGERISSVRYTMSRPTTPTPPPPPPPPALLLQSSPSPSRASVKESSTYYPPKHTPSPYLQPSKGITLLKPNDQHKSKMQELIKMIPCSRLRKTDTITGPDGVSRPNPFWHEIYNHGRRI